jgi:hypothetical protein
VTGPAGPAFDRLDVARGASIGDLDNDGDSDLVIFNNSGPLRVVRNETGSRQHWLGLRVIDRRRDAVQTRIELVRPKAAPLVRRVQIDGSYGSSSDPRVIFGLARESTPQTVRVKWAGGQVEEFRDLVVDRYWTLEAGKAAK